MKRFIIQLGTGIDLHGQNATVAAQRAVRDAIGRNSLIGLREIAGMSSADQMVVEVTVACPYPAESVNADEVLSVLPFGKKSLKVVPGGMLAPSGATIKNLGDKNDDIVICNASVLVGLAD